MATCGFRYTLRTLGIAVVGASVVGAYLANRLSQIKAESTVGILLEQAAEADVLDSHQTFGLAISKRSPIERFRCLLYRLAGSKGEITRIDIFGERSAQVVINNANSFRNVNEIRLNMTTKDGERGWITEGQIHAAANIASKVKSLQNLEIYGKIRPNADLSPLASCKIEFFQFESSEVLPSPTSQLGTLNIDRLRICLDYDSVNDTSIPAAAFSSFGNSPCRIIEISGAIDDDALEAISKAPKLELLSIWHPQYHTKRQITDDGLRRACKQLHVHSLEIQGSQITDAAVVLICEIDELKWIRISGLTEAGINRLRELRPDVIVE